MKEPGAVPGAVGKGWMQTKGWTLFSMPRSYKKKKEAYASLSRIPYQLPFAL